MCISTQSRSHLNPIQVSRFVSDLHSGSQIHVSSLSQLNPTSFWVLIFTSGLHPGNISPPFRSRKLHLSSIQASSQTHTGFTMCLTSSWILPHSGSWYLHLAYILEISRLHSGPENCILVPSKHHLKPIQVSRCVSLPSRPFLSWRIVSQLHPSPKIPHPRLKMCTSAQSRSYLNPIQVSRCVSPLHPGSQIHVSSLSQLNLTSIWVLIFASRFHPGNISPPFSSTKLHLSSIQASSQTHTSFKMCVSPPSRSFLN